MRIYPAIDIKDGHCVRLVQGDFNQVTIFDENPAKVAKRWEEMGAEYLHLVDLDGARHGTAHNDQAVKQILKTVSIPVQIGGGIRTIDDIRTKLEMGVSRVILGTTAVLNPELTRNALSLYGEQIVAGVDASNGKAAISGWAEISERDSLSLIRELHEAGVQTVIYTDVAKDGMMSGPNIHMYQEAVSPSGPKIIAAGGVCTMEDLCNLKAAGVEGAIIGKALYLGSVNLQEAIEVTQQCSN